MQRPLRDESGDRGGTVAKGVKRFRPDQRPKKERLSAPKRGLTAAEEAAAAAYEAKLETPRVITRWHEGADTIGACRPMRSAPLPS